MKTFIVLPLLAVAALAAPQLDAEAGSKPVPEANPPSPAAAAAATTTAAAAATNGTQPAKDGRIRILSSDDYDQGIAALFMGDQAYHRYSLLARLLATQHTGAATNDAEVDDFLAKIAPTNEARADKARKAFADAKAAFGRAVAPEHVAAVDKGLDEAKGKLNAAWNEANGLVGVGKLTDDVMQWFNNH